MLQEEKDHEFDLSPSKLLQHWMSDISEDNVVKLNFTESHNPINLEIEITKILASDAIYPYNVFSFYQTSSPQI